MAATSTKYIKYLLTALGAASLIATGCGGDEFDTINNDGTFTGYIVDARTGAPIDFDPDNDADGTVYAVDLGEIVLGEPCAEDPEDLPAGTDLSGCIIIKGLNTNITHQIIVDRPGYHGFHGQFAINGHVHSNNTLVKPEPAVHRNIRLFPQGQGVNYNVDITTAVGTDIEGGVDVDCIYANQGDFDLIGDSEPEDTPADPFFSSYLEPVNLFAPVLSETSNAQGIITFAGADLVKGGRYICEAMKSTTTGIIWHGQREFVVGITGSELVISLTRVPAPNL